MRKKLTLEVFTRPECPKWAKWAAVDSDGTAYWYEEKPTLSSGGTFWVPEDYAPKWAYINGKFSRTVDLIKRKQSQTNLEWLCEHPEELAKRLIHFDDRMGAWLAPDGTFFYPYDTETGIISICLEYTLKWLKQEHKENNNEQKQS